MEVVVTVDENSSYDDIKSVYIKLIDDNKGKGLFAAHQISEGSILFKEVPLVCAQFLWNEFYKYKACEYCMKALETAEANAQRLSANPSLVLPHPECCRVNPQSHVECPQCRVEYCSKECRSRAWQKYHQVLCVSQHPPDPDHPLVMIQDVWRNMHFPPETTSIMLLAKMIAIIKQAKDKDNAIERFANFCRATANEEKELVHKLMGTRFQEQFDTLLSVFTAALQEDTVAHWFTPEGIRSLFALIGTNGQGVGTSSLSVYVSNCDDLHLEEEERQKLDSFIDQIYVDIENESGNFLNCEGSALYSLQSCCNHSCDPNAEVQFLDQNSTMSLVALKNIAEGDEINICYLDECAQTRSRHSRQKLLKLNYLFVCDCSKCREQCDDPDQTSSEEDDSSMEEDD
ncbi:protein-lysine N-trimethyltransferase SMYD5-like isoform X2 [Antedon mediterranea]|uniref:protein-lysine N-trimethyltransferase SMYD5-like isoform X2 n=1 Tax=Antedon mediterranea TaxID=105859 RepID=UPI003AF7B0DC